MNLFQIALKDGKQWYGQNVIRRVSEVRLAEDDYIIYRQKDNLYPGDWFGVPAELVLEVREEPK